MLQQVIDEPRIFATGFYDEDGVWFYTWERDREDAHYSYECANTHSTRTTHIRYSRPGQRYGEMYLIVYLAHGQLPPV